RFHSRLAGKYVVAADVLDWPAVPGRGQRLAQPGAGMRLAPGVAAGEHLAGAHAIRVVHVLENVEAQAAGSVRENLPRHIHEALHETLMVARLDTVFSKDNVHSVPLV